MNKDEEKNARAAKDKAAADKVAANLPTGSQAGEPSRRRSAATAADPNIEYALQMALEAISALEQRVAELEKPAKARNMAEEMKRRRGADILLQHLAGTLARGEATEDQLRNMPKAFTQRFEKVIGPDWVDKAVAMFEVAKADRVQ